MNTIATKPPSAGRTFGRFLWTSLIAVVIVGISIYPVLSRGGSIAFHPHTPNWALWRGLAFQVQWHVVAAVTATVIGFVVISLPKGSRLHKALGWAWVIAMAATAGTSFIRELNPGGFSFIHIISGWTMVALPLGIYAIRRRNVLGHRLTMLGLFFGGSLVAGLLTFIPGRFMYQLFFG